MPNLQPLKDAFQDTIKFLSENMINLLPYMGIFLIISLIYSAVWYSLDNFTDVACINNNYLVEFLFCKLYLGVIGKHFIAVIIGALSIIPFASLVYYTHMKANKSDVNIVSALRGSYKAILKILAFRAGLTLLLYLPFIISLILLGGEIQSKIIEYQRLTLTKLFMVTLIPIPATLIFAFLMQALLEPFLQYVEYDMLVYGSRMRQAIIRSITLATRYKTSSVAMAVLSMLFWYGLALLKYLYTVHPLLIISLLASLFFEATLVFPGRTVLLYFLWKNVLEGKEKEDKVIAEKEYRSYLNKMMLG